ncbi:MAG: hypothetical protein OHK93_005288 [Ramalina farinacea]|uniref:SET domain-containing protein n=1 Tax=Ramalina farinacea TaxID=258253 RepID=A0AA43QVS0_9LECA|nr:hypothetical protein [Ramalina farinacea]
MPDLIHIDLTKPFTESAYARPMMNYKRQEGNLEYKRGNFERAILLYDYALKNAKSAQDAVPLFLSRSLARHSNQQYEQSLADAEAALELQPGNDKALLRKSRAFYSLRKHADAEAALLQLKELQPNHPNLKGDLAKCAKRRQEESNGLYDFAAMLDEATKKYPKPYMDRASFGSPAMQRKPCEEEGKGRGMFATRDIEVGELLMVEKAFATVFNDQIPSTSGETKDEPVVDPKTGLTSIKSNRAMAEELLEIVLKELERNPSKIGKFARLYPGPNIHEEVEPDSHYDDGCPCPIIESRDAVLTRILYNSFAFPLLSRDFHWRAAHSGTEPPTTVHGRRGGSTTPTTPTNATPAGPLAQASPINGHTNTAAGVNAEMDPNSSIGVWLLSSYFNHSCHPSVRRSFIGDIIIFRAQVPITRGTELTTGYVTNHETLADRAADIKNWGFECNCPRCENQAKETQSTRDNRRQIMSELVDAFEKPNPTSMEDYFAQLNRLSATYGSNPTSEDPRTVLVLPCITIMRAAAHEGMPHTVVKLALFMLRGLGFEILVTPRREWRVLRWGMYDDEVVGVMAEMWRAYAEVDPEIVKQVEGYLRLAYLVVCGEDTSFEGRYGTWRHGFGAAGEKREENLGSWQDNLMVEQDAERNVKEKQKEVVRVSDPEDEGNSTVSSSFWPAEWRDSVREAPRPTQQDKSPSPPTEPLSPLYKTSFGEDGDGEDGGSEDGNGGVDEGPSMMDVDVDENGGEEEDDDAALDEEGGDMDALVKQVNTKLGMKTWKHGPGD